MTIQNGNHPKCVDEVRGIRSINGEIREGLRNQQAILQLRKVSVPDNVIDNASGIDGQLDKLEHTLLDEQTELEQLRAVKQANSNFASFAPPKMKNGTTLAGQSSNTLCLRNNRC